MCASKVNATGDDSRLFAGAANTVSDKNRFAWMDCSDGSQLVQPERDGTSSNLPSAGLKVASPDRRPAPLRAPVSG